MRLNHYKDLLKLGFPIIIGQLGTIILGFVDTLMIGHHTMPELAAASFVNALFSLIFVISLGFTNGLTPIIGGHYGRGESASIALVLKNAIAVCGLLAAVLFSVMTVVYFSLGHLGQPESLLPLMRPYFLIQLVSLPFVVAFNMMKQFSDGMLRTQTGMWIVLAGNLLNILGNWLLIYGHWGLPELGLTGAGLSTLFSRVLMALFFMGVLGWGSHYKEVRSHLKSVRVERKEMRRITVLGIPLALQIGMETSAFQLSSIIVGWIGVSALAANQIVMVASQFCYFISLGMAVAVSIRVSLYYGQGDYQGVRANVRAGLVLVFILLAITGSVVWTVRWKLGGWFTTGGDVTRLVALTVIPLLVYQVSDGVQNTFANTLRGLSHVKVLVPVAFLAYFVVTLPLCYVFGITLGGGLVGIWWAFFFGLSIAAVLFVREYLKVMKRVGQGLKSESQE